MAKKRAISSPASSYSYLSWDDVFNDTDVDQDDEEISLFIKETEPSDILAVKEIGLKYLQTQVQFYIHNRTKVLMVLEAIDNVESMGSKRAWIQEMCPSPSTLGDFSKWGRDNWQEKLRILCHRPDHGLHVTLQVKAFGEFVDEIKSNDIIDHEFIDCALEMMLGVHEFKDENDKKVNIREVLGKLFKDYTVGSKQWGSSATGVSDISISYDDRVFVNVEELSSGGADPNFENIGYFIKFQQSRQSPYDYSPMFLVSVAGPHYLQVFGATWDSGLICVDPLCGPVSLLYVPSEPRQGAVQVARVLQALVNGTNRLKDPVVATECISKGPYFNSVAGSKLQKIKRIGNRLRTFEAVLNGKQVVFKFPSLRYGIEVHQHLAEKNLAPKLLHSESLPGGWVVVVMEKILNAQQLSGEVSDGLKDSLRHVLTCLNEKKFVHGDLRRQNILTLEDDTVRVVDFDWAGSTGDARYPIDLNLSPQCGWHNGVQRGALIQSCHDQYLVEELINN